MAKASLYKYVLALGDDALILGQRLSQWAYKGPFLEEDIALSNISLDMFGRANLLLEYAANLTISSQSLLTSFSFICECSIQPFLNFPSIFFPPSSSATVLR